MLESNGALCWWGSTSLLCSTSNTRMPESHVACMGCGGDQPVSFVPLPTPVCRKATWLAWGVVGTNQSPLFHFQHPYAGKPRGLHGVCWGPASLLCSTSNTRIPESHVACMGCAGDQPVSSIIMLHFQTTLTHQSAIPAQSLQPSPFTR